MAVIVMTNPKHSTPSPSAPHASGPALPDAAARHAQAALARQILQAEAAAVAGVVIDDAFHRVVELILTHTGDVPSGPDAGGTRSGGGALVISGLGKNGPVGQKMSATFASTGTPSYYLHPTEAMHGDLGRIRRGDIVLLMSFGGATEEVLSLAAILRQDGVATIAMTGRPESELAQLCTLSLCIGPVTEACPHNLAPTASTTAMMALGDALALCVSRRRNFGVDDFRRFHPGGNLGRHLLPVTQAMRFRIGANLPAIPPTQRLDAAYRDIEAAAEQAGIRRPGALLVVDASGQLMGIFTDGDLRRLMMREGGAALTRPIGEVMTANPRRLREDQLVRDAVQLMRQHRIDEIPVVSAAGAALGMIDVQDLVALKVIEG